MSPYFPKAYETFGGEISVKNVLSNYEQKLIQKMQQELIHIN